MFIWDTLSIGVARTIDLEAGPLIGIVGTNYVGGGPPIEFFQTIHFGHGPLIGICLDYRLNN